MRWSKSHTSNRWCATRQTGATASPLHNYSGERRERRERNKGRTLGAALAVALLFCAAAVHAQTRGTGPRTTAPESNQKPFGAAATAALRSLLPAGARAQLELDVGASDQYGRVLGYVWINGRMALLPAGTTIAATKSWTRTPRHLFTHVPRNSMFADSPSHCVPRTRRTE